MRRARWYCVLLLLIAFATNASPCSLARPYFYQVSQLRGRVVGAKLGPLQYIRWLRQSFSRSNAKLTLYEYRSPVRSWGEFPLLRTVDADRGGNFDFGDLPKGHYVLEVKDSTLHDWFEVEVTATARPTDSVLIDISPFFPDCKGGHEFVVRTK